MHSPNFSSECVIDPNEHTNYGMTLSTQRTASC
jgi:hypothetical protein